MIVRIGGASWVQSTGGPTIFVSRTLVRAWTGAVADSEKLSGQTRLDPGHVHDQDDYTRACQVRDYVDILRVNGGDALVLNDLPLLTTWRSSPTGAAGMIVRWEFVDDESAVDRY